MQIPEIQLTPVSRMLAAPNGPNTMARSISDPRKYSSHAEALEAMHAHAHREVSYDTTDEERAQQFIQFVCRYAVFYETLS